jgi:hypothetical protein
LEAWLLRALYILLLSVFISGIMDEVDEYVGFFTEQQSAALALHGRILFFIGTIILCQHYYTIVDEWEGDVPWDELRSKTTIVAVYWLSSDNQSLNSLCNLLELICESILSGLWFFVLLPERIISVSWWLLGHAIRGCILFVKDPFRFIWYWLDIVGMVLGWIVICLLWLVLFGPQFIFVFMRELGFNIKLVHSRNPRRLLEAADGSQTMRRNRSSSQ